MNQFPDDFSNPGSEYRGAPFWAWNGDLNPEELRRQIRIMDKMGLGGFFMHSRVGLGTPYLSERWMNCIRNCVEEAKTLGMRAWLYDEDRWPSGAAGGLVTKNPAYRQHKLRLSVCNEPSSLPAEGTILKSVLVRIDGSTASVVRQVAAGETPPAPGSGETLLVFSDVEAEGSSWYNGFTYLDTLNAEAVREFIRVTHEAYGAEFGQDFATVIPGIFTDEPQHAPVHVENGSEAFELPWTSSLPEIFRQRYGYDLLDHLSELFYDRSDGVLSKARYHFHDCVTHLFVTAFAQQIGDWCEHNNMLHTGHLMAEPTLSSQTRFVTNCMRFYEYMQAPGMDLLTEYNREYDTAKQVASAARQFGRKWRLTETYGCTGWNFPMAGHKALGDWQAALGINLRCQHLSWYTMEGQAKRDYPASVFYQSPWWEYYGHVEDYFARIHSVMTRGQEIRDVLVVHPIESMWTTVRMGWPETVEARTLDRTLIELRDTLLAENIDFDYGDEDILARHAEVLPADPASLRVGEARYRTIVVPPLKTIRKSTLDLLRSFQKAGGQVVFAGEPSSHLDAEPSDAAAKLAAACVRAPASGSELARAVGAASRRLSIADSHGQQVVPALYLLRENDEAFYLFVCNTGHDFRGMDRDDRPVKERTLAFDSVCITGFEQCQGHPLELDPQTGDSYAAEADRKDGAWHIQTSLTQIGSRLFVIPKRRRTDSVPARAKLETVRTESMETAPWEIRLSDHNVLVLDRPGATIGDNPANPPEEVLRVDRRVRDALNIPHRGGRMKQPWAQDKPAEPRRIPVVLDYTFDVETVPRTSLWLGLENPHRYRISLNGEAVCPDSQCGWWVDRSLRTLPIDPALLNAGVNRLRLEIDYDEGFAGLEIVYLLGDFGVDVSGTKITMTESPRYLNAGDWVSQGLPFYSGNVTYDFTVEASPRSGERWLLTADSWHGVATRILVNGSAAGIIAWPPYELDVTDFITTGVDTISVEVLGHRRNSHGPLHRTDPHPRWTGPFSFATEGEEWQEDYHLVPCGLTAPPRMVVRRPVQST